MKMKKNHTIQVRHPRTLNVMGLIVFAIVALICVPAYGPIATRSGKVQAYSPSASLPVTLTLSEINSKTVPGTVPGPITLATYFPTGQSGDTLRGYNDPCGFNWHADNNVTNAELSALDYKWAQGYDRPLMYDLGAPSNNALVFPILDHNLVPYESLEFTVWGSNDPNATFPDAWEMATLNTVYAEGWAPNDPNCSPFGTDDYCSLWSFGTNNFRYIAVYANSSVHMTPEMSVPGDADSNDCLGMGYTCSHDCEIDTVGTLAQLPGCTACNAPVISGCSTDKTSLWPLNHKFVDITVNYTVTGDPAPTCVLSVTSNEPINGTGDGDMSPDWLIVDAHHVRLRAERAGTGTGRIYTITITCTNDQGTASCQTSVLVPHDQGR